MNTLRILENTFSIYNCRLMIFWFFVFVFREHLINLTIQEKVKIFHHQETVNQNLKTMDKRQMTEQSNFTTKMVTQDNSLMKMVKKFLSRLFNNNTICKCSSNNKWINNTIKNKNTGQKAWITDKKEWINNNEEWALQKLLEKTFYFFS